MADAGQQVPVEQLLGREPRRRKKWQRNLGALTNWRDWSLPVKLAAVTLVPIILAVALGVSVLSAKNDRTDDYERIDTLMALNGATSALLDSVQSERTETAAQLTKGAGSTSSLQQARAAVDGGTEALTATSDDARSADDGIAAPADGAVNAVDRISSVRADVDNGQLDAAQATQEYSTVTRELLQLQDAAVARVGDSEFGGTPEALRELNAAKESVSLEQAVVGYGVARGSLAPSELNQVRTAEVRIEDRLSNFTAVAGPAERELLDSTISAEASEERGRLISSVLGELGPSSARAIDEMSESEWSDNSGQVFDQLGVVSQQLNDEVEATAGELAGDSRTSFTVVAVLLALALLLAIAVVFVVARQLLHSLRTLRRGALDVADERLGEAVRAIQEGNGDATDVEPVPVLTKDEVGEVARAFDAVHSQALKLAAEQAAMRTAYSGVFVNLSRRSQSLVQRQLGLIEQLERDEEDADQLAILFQLDHLATRMRRNNENLMMLSGSESTRRSGRPVSTADVLRAAVSEIEQYQRVVVQTPPTTKVVGHVASDLMRLLAELLDNATAFSPPQAQVTVVTSVTDRGSMTIDVLDTGIGMSDAEVAEANARMTEAPSLAMVTSRRMGLFVVGRLAGKHGISVSLHGGTGVEGVRATVVVPEDQVIGAGGGPLTSEIPIITDGTELPRRTPGASEGMPAAPEANGQGTPAVSSPGQGSQPTETTSTLFAADHDQHTNGHAGGAGRGADLPSGQALFAAGTTPLSQWWNATTATGDDDAGTAENAADRPDQPETTPIYDQMLSVWFRADAAGAQDDSARPAGWQFDTDDMWRTVAEVNTRQEPAAVTEAGLPRRNRGEQLLPGRAAAPEEEEAQSSRSSLGHADRRPRDPADVRGRLSSFQRGLRRGKHALTPAQEQAQTAAQEQTSDQQASTASQDPTASTSTSDAPASGTGTPAAGVAPTNGVPEQPNRGSAEQDESTPAGAPDADGSADVTVPEPTEPSSAETTDVWDFSSDAAWEDAKAVADAKPTNYTDSGLPRRQRGERLVPGNPTSAPAARQAARQPERDPNAMRGRLSSFQQGVRRGRQNTNTSGGDTTTNGSFAATTESATSGASPGAAADHKEGQ